MPRGKKAAQRQTVLELQDAIESLQQANQAFSSKAEKLQEQNYILRKNLDTIRDELANATGLSLGRMIIEAGLAVNELRESMPTEPIVSEANLEEGELIDPSVSIWKNRLDKMILRISEAHTKAKVETQEVVDKIKAMAEEMQRSRVLPAACGSATTAKDPTLAATDPPLRRSKRLRDQEETQYAGGDGEDDEEDTDYEIQHNQRKKARCEDSTHQFQPTYFHLVKPFGESAFTSNTQQLHAFQSDENRTSAAQSTPQQGFQSSAQQIPHDGVPRVPMQQDEKDPLSTHDLKNALEHIPLGKLQPNTISGTGQMHADRQRMLQTIKVEEDIEDISAVKPAPVSSLDY